MGVISQSYAELKVIKKWKSEGRSPFLTPRHSQLSSITLLGAGVETEVSGGNETEGNEETSYLLGWLDMVLVTRISGIQRGLC